MKQLECMIAWTPESWRDSRPKTVGQVTVGPWPDVTGWSDDYAFTVGACMVALHKMDRGRRTAMLFIDFNTVVVRDKIDPQVAHRAFLAIDEYAEHISPDTPGARWPTEN